MSNNTIYILLGSPEGKGEENRSKNNRAQADGHPNPSSRRCIRHSVQRESILRPKGSPSGPLRDAAPAQRGGALDRRHSNQLRRFPTHRLPGSVGVRTSWPEWAVSQTPWTQRRTRSCRGGHRICAGLAGSRRELDDRCLYPSYSGKVRDQSAPTQSGEGTAEQKKPAQSSLDSPIPEGTIEAYEGLRRQVVQPDGRGEHLEGRGILMRCGLATWAQSRPAAVPARPPESHFPSGPEAPVLDSFGAELVRLVAGLILSTRQEGFPHA